MSVLSCDRRGCPHVMCERLIQTSDGDQYICDGCFVELQKLAAKWPSPMLRKDVVEAVTEFMDSAQVEYGDDEVDPLEAIGALTRTGEDDG